MKLGEDREGRLLLIPFAPGIGDMVMMEPLLRAVVNRMRGWHVTMPAKEYATDLLPPGDYELVSPSYFVTQPAAPLRPFHRLLPQRLVAWAAEPLMTLDLGPFESVINLFWAWESKVAFDQWWTPQWPPANGAVHAIDLLSSYLEEELGEEIPRNERFPRIETFPEAVRWAAGYLGEEGLLPGAPVAALVPVASNSLKWWDPGRWADVNDRLVHDGWLTVLIAPAEHPHAVELFNRCGAKPLWPQLTLRQLNGLIGQCDLTVGVDTGPLHVASALGVPWVGLFGSTNPDLIGPYDRTRGRSLIAPFPKAPSCSQCWLAFKNREERCLTLPSTGCTTIIAVEEVLEAVAEVTTGTLIAPELPSATRGNGAFRAA